MTRGPLPPALDGGRDAAGVPAAGDGRDRGGALGNAGLAGRIISWALALAAPVVLTLLFLVAYASLDHVDPDVGRARQFHILVAVLAGAGLATGLALARRDLRLLWAVPGGVALGAGLALKARQYTHNSCDFLGFCTPVGSAAPGIFLLGLGLLVLTVVLAAALRGRSRMAALQASSIAVATMFLVASGFFLATLEAQARRADAMSTNESIPAPALALLAATLLAAALGRRRRAP